MKAIIVLFILLAGRPAHADPQLTSWYTEDSGQYARIYQSSAAETAGSVSKTWSRGSGIQNTATYMHDGRFTTLEEVIEHYSSGVHRSATLDPNLAKHPEKGLHLSTSDKAALVAFLKTLTEETKPAP